MSVPKKNGFPAFLRRTPMPNASLRWGTPWNTAYFPHWKPCGYLKKRCVERRKYRDLYEKRPKNDQKSR